MGCPPPIPPFATEHRSPFLLFLTSPWAGGVGKAVGGTERHCDTRHPRRIGSTPQRQRAQVAMMSHAAEGTRPIMAGLRSRSALDKTRVELTTCLGRAREHVLHPRVDALPREGNVFPVWAALTEMTSQVLSSMPCPRTCEHHCLAKGGCCYYSQWSRCMLFDAYMHP